MTFHYRARVEDYKGNRWSLLGTTAAKLCEIADAQHAAIVWIKRLDVSVTI